MTRPKYRQSEIQTFLKCGKLWEFRYLQGLKTPPRAALTVGSAVDKAVTHNLVSKVLTGVDLPLEGVLQVAADSFEAGRAETDFQGDDPGHQKDMAIEMTRVHHLEVAPKILPATVQEEFMIETDAGYDLGGTIDLTETDDTVVDTKTAKAAYGEDQVADSLQASMYDFAFETLRGRPAKGFRFDVLIKPTKTKGPRYQAVPGKVTEAHREFLFETIGQMHKAIQAGVTLPAPEGAWWCSKDWCGYWSQCKGKGRS